MRHFYNHPDKVLVVDRAIVDLAEHVLDLLVGELHTEVGRHDLTKLVSGNETVAIAVEGPEVLNELLVRKDRGHLTGHQNKELREIDGSVTVLILVVDQLLKFVGSRVLTCSDRG